MNAAVRLVFRNSSLFGVCDLRCVISVFWYVKIFFAALDKDRRVCLLGLTVFFFLYIFSCSGCWTTTRRQREWACPGAHSTTITWGTVKNRNWIQSTRPPLGNSSAPSSWAWGPAASAPGRLTAVAADANDSDSVCVVDVTSVMMPSHVEELPVETANNSDYTNGEAASHWFLALLSMCPSEATLSIITMASGWNQIRPSTGCRRTPSTWPWGSSLCTRNRGQAGNPCLSFCALWWNLHVYLLFFHFEPVFNLVLKLVVSNEHFSCRSFPWGLNNQICLIRDLLIRDDLSQLTQAHLFHSGSSLYRRWIACLTACVGAPSTAAALQSSPWLLRANITSSI